MANYLLDTDVLIDFFKGRPEAVAGIMALAKDGHTVGLCCVNLAEFHAGLSETQRAGADALLDRLAYFEVTPRGAKLAGEFRYRYARKGVSLATTDALVAGAAIANNAHVVTRNVSHYPMSEVQLVDLFHGHGTE